MGYRKVPRIYTLTFDGDREGFVVRMKSMKLGQMRAILEIINDEDRDTVAELPAYIAKHIVSWNLEDEHGRPIEPSLEAMDELDMDDLLEISKKWMDLIVGPDEELGKDSPSGGPFPGRPVQMEAL